MTLENGSQEEGNNATAEHMYRRDLPCVILALQAKPCLENTERCPGKSFSGDPE